MIYITLISLIIAVISLRYAISLRQYLKNFTEVSQKIRNKEFYARLDESNKGQLGEISSNFNSMIFMMEQTIKELEANRIKTESILKSISDGILAIDINSNIILINSKAKDMLGCNDECVEGNHINHSIHQNDVLREIMYYRGTKEIKKVEITLDTEEVYAINFDPIYLQENKEVIIGTIVNIKDITQRVKLENMRSEFVANVTHELKTPLTSISGFVETLRLNENINVSTRNRFLGIIETESNRLKRLIDDILLLSFTEEKSNAYKEIVIINDVYNEIEDIVNSLANTKDIEINSLINPQKIELLANREYIKQILLNVISNAIKYTNDGKQIFIDIHVDNKNVVISIKDQGIGIPKEDIPRIFERFYRVDKARSRDVGGTGLGLAITKHMVKSMNGTIEVKSELGVGSEFTINIPQKNFL